ncbi:MAG: hypothetical protein ACHQX1_00685 [Candidatus Micrarchaeales archaeon]
MAFVTPYGGTGAAPLIFITVGIILLYKGIIAGWLLISFGIILAIMIGLQGRNKGIVQSEMTEGYLDDIQHEMDDENDI